MFALALRLVFSLAVVLGLLILLTKIGGRRFRGRKDSLVQVLHRQPISRGTAVTVVTVGSRVLVLGTTEQQVRVLTELDPDEVVDHLPDDETVAGEILTLVPSSDDPTVLVEATPDRLPVARPVGAHRAAAATARSPRGARRADRTPRAVPATRTAEAGGLSGSVLSPDTWRQALAAATRRVS